MILIGFGANLPFCGYKPAETIEMARIALGVYCSFERQSSLFASPAWPDASDPPYVNAVCAVSTQLNPGKLLALLHRIEASFGRRRDKLNAPRTLDLDLLAYNAVCQKGFAAEDLEIPHPRLASRDFVLAPLLEIAPDWKHPLTGFTVGQMLESLPERRAVRL